MAVFAVHVIVLHRSIDHVWYAGSALLQNSVLAFPTGFAMAASAEGCKQSLSSLHCYDVKVPSPADVVSQIALIGHLLVQNSRQNSVHKHFVEQTQWQKP
ncbi:hypothetical protein D9K79_18250 [Acinetobacter cumulans]|uniref:Uncharacterized protein n=1 Tax=Acinetobacter cumulans TaxID=2136182 RepID=A0ABX9U0Y2_9GAMM|nr:hypothetical protein D9K79_18250 [Acinetobacter cumulans]